MAPFRLRKNDTVYDKVEGRVVDVLYRTSGGEYLIKDADGIERARKRSQLSFRRREKEGTKMRIRLREGDIVERYRRDLGARKPNPTFAVWANKEITVTQGGQTYLILRNSEFAAKLCEDGLSYRLEHGSDVLYQRVSEFLENFRTEAEASVKTDRKRAWTRKDMHIYHDGKLRKLEAGTMVWVARYSARDIYNVTYCDMEWCESVSDFAGGYETEYQRAKSGMAAKMPRKDVIDMKQYEVDEAIKGIYDTRDTRVAELEAQIKQKNTEDYGTVSECHMWEVEYSIPHRFGRGGTERIAEILTTQRNMAEAGIAAEAVAKDDSLNAVVIAVTYKRRLFRTK